MLILLFTDPLTEFSCASCLCKFFVTGYWIIIQLPNRQQETESFEFLLHTNGIIAISITNDYIKISAQSYVKTLGAGGINQTAKAPVDPRILGGFPLCAMHVLYL